MVSDSELCQYNDYLFFVLLSDHQCLTQHCSALAE